MFWGVFLATRHVGSWLPNQGSNPTERQILTTGPPGKLHQVCLWIEAFKPFILSSFRAEVLGLASVIKKVPPYWRQLDE